MKTAKYNTLKGRELMHGFAIEIQTDETANVRTVFVNSIWHVNKRIKMPTHWGVDFTDSQILHSDTLSRQVKERYGNILKAVQPEM